MTRKDHIIRERILDPIRLYIPFVASLFFSFLLQRCVELIVVYCSNHLPLDLMLHSIKGIPLDVVLSLKIGAILYPFFWLCFLSLKSIGKIFSRIAIVFVILIYLIIDKYFTTTLVPLGADFWAYSFDDFATTIKSSASVSWLEILPVLMVPAITLFFYKKISPLYCTSNLYPALAPIFLIFLYLGANNITPERSQFQSDLQYHLAVNKASFFIDASKTFFADNRKNNSTFLNQQFADNPYPFLKPFKEADVLGPYLNLGDSKPNLVFIQVEGLGKSFTGPNADNGGFTPFLDSLAEVSLYWNNCIAPTGRTFGILPNLYGSLPFGQKGFNEMGEKMPRHQTLISQLINFGYTTNYFYGGDDAFDKQHVFLKRQGIDFILNENGFPERYQKMNLKNNSFSWGFNDKDVFQYSLEILKQQSKSPRMDMYMTLVNHEPFTVPEEKYTAVFKSTLESIAKADKDKYLTYQNIYECLLYTDDAIKEFIYSYRQNLEFNNTIFIITGDHRMIPIPHRNNIDRFHVPLLIWSPMVKQPQQFDFLVSHSQIAPTFLALFQHNYGLQVPQQMAFIASAMTIKNEFGSSLNQPIMKNKGDLNSYILDDVFLDNGSIYKILPNMELEKIDSRTKKRKLERNLNDYKAMNAYTTQNNALYKD